MFPTGVRGSRVGEERGGCGRVPGDAMPREKRKMPAVSSRPVGVVVWRVPKKPSPLRGLGSWWLFFFPIGAGAVRGGRFVRAGAAPMVVAVAT